MEVLIGVYVLSIEFLIIGCTIQIIKAIKESNK